MSNLPTGRPSPMELGVLVTAVTIIIVIYVAFLGPILTPIVSS